MKDFEKPIGESVEHGQNRISELFDRNAVGYDRQLEKIDYQGLKTVEVLFRKYGIESGSVLDVGCGTGKLKDYLGELFTYIGIDLSEKMLDEAKKRGFEVHRGPLEKVIKNFADRSVDHVVCVGVSGFVENLDGLVKEFLRVAKKSVLFAVEQLPEDLVTHMKEYRRIQIHNHPQFLLKTSTEQIKGVPFWRSEDGIVLADVYFQKLSE